MTPSTTSSRIAAPRSIEFRVKRQMSLEAYRQRKDAGELSYKKPKRVQDECDISNEADRLVDMAETDDRLEYLIKCSPRLTLSESAELDLHHHAVHTLLQYAAEQEGSEQRCLYSTLNDFDPLSASRKRKREREEREDKDIVRAEQELMMLISPKRRRISRPSREPVLESASSSESDTFILMNASRILQEQAKRDITRGEQERMMLRPPKRRPISRPSQEPILDSTSSSESDTFVPMTTSRILQERARTHQIAQRRRPVPPPPARPSTLPPSRKKREYTEVGEDEMDWLR